MAKEAIPLQHIKAVSPTLAETLRLCKLRAGLSRAKGASQHVLGNPKAWLGIAYHAVLEGIGPEHGNNVDARIYDLWKTEIEHQHERSRAHPFDRRFGPPESWPGYHMVAAMALLRARELANAAAGKGKPASNGQPGGTTLREMKFSGAGGKLVGRPDVVRAEEVVDFKTGDLFEDENQEQVKGAYIRQLRLYAFLVKESLGWWPRRGILLPMSGSPVIVEVDPDECQREAEEAVRLLSEYNEIISGDLDPIELANPTPASCRWCQYQLFCPAFWRSVGPDWINDLRSGSVAGTAIGPAQRIHGGVALSLSLQAERGVVPAGDSVSLFPLDPSEHSDVPRAKEGDQVRVTGLWKRADDSFVATKRTMIALERTLPRVEIGA